MKGRVFFALLLLLILAPVPGHTQSVRVVRGMISDKDGRPLQDVKITATTGEVFELKDAGQFEIRVSTLCRVLTFSSPHYFDLQKELTGSFLQVILEYDNSALLREEKERQDAEKERLAAEEKARKEAEAKQKAEEEAKAKAEKERLATEEKARKEAETKARAEEDARIKAEKERRATEAKAKLQAKEAAYDEKFVNKGLSHSVRVSFAYQVAKCETVYLYSGYRSYGTLHPFSFDYTLSYKFNRIFAIGVGAGVLFNAKSITIVGDKFICSQFKERRLDIPLFATVSTHFGRGKIRPSLALSGGYYPLSRTVLAEGMLGMEYRLGRHPSIELGILIKTTPYPSFDLESETGKYKTALSPGIAVRFNF